MERADNWKLTDQLHAPMGKGDPFAAAVRATRMPMLITDPRQPDNIIVFANDAFLRLTGYERQEVMGRNCRFLQGPGTDRQSVMQIRNAVAAKKDIAIDLLNYRKDGTPFWNALYISPVVDESGELLFYFASQVDVTDRRRAEQDAVAERSRIEAAVKDRTRELEAVLARQTELLHEVDHRVKNNLQLVSALIVLEAKSAGEKTADAALRSLKGRLEALSAVHRRLYRDGDTSRFDVGTFMRDLAGEALHDGPDRISLDLAEAPVSAAFAAPVALIAGELVRIGAEVLQADETAHLLFRITETGEARYRFCIIADGRGDRLAEVVEKNSRTFLTMLARQLRADVHWPAADSDSICVDVPVDELARGG